MSKPNIPGEEWERGKASPTLKADLGVELARCGAWGASSHPLGVIRHGFGSEMYKTKTDLVLSDFRKAEGSDKAKAEILSIVVDDGIGQAATLAPSLN